jgi:hypothetical protein
MKIQSTFDMLMEIQIVCTFFQLSTVLQIFYITHVSFFLAREKTMTIITLEIIINS